MRYAGRFSPLLLLLLLAAPARGGSYPRRMATQDTHSTSPRLMSFGFRRAKAPKQKAPEEALATFTGIVRAIDSKLLRLDSPEGEPLDFNISRKTRYSDGPKEIKRDGIKAGDHVSVEARPMPDGKPDAVTVRLDHTPVHKEP